MVFLTVIKAEVRAYLHCVHLEIPQDTKSPLGELEREAIPLFPMAPKAEKLAVEAHTSGENDAYISTFGHQ